MKRMCKCNHDESKHEPNGEIRNGPPPCTECLCTMFNVVINLEPLASAIVRQLKWQHEQMELRIKQKIERMKKAQRKRKSGNNSQFGLP